MKRFLSTLLCAILLLGLLPAVSPPAEMITTAGAYVNTQKAYVGDRLTWTIFGQNGIGPWETAYEIFKEQTVILSELVFDESLSISHIPTMTGIYSAKIRVLDINNFSVIVIYGPTVTVSLRLAPKITKVEALSGTSLKVTWTKVAGATGYILLRSTSKTGTYSKIKTTTATSFINTGLTPGKAYYYKVECYNLIGVTQYISSGYSAIKAGVPLAKPAAPTATILGPTSVKVSWSAVTGATGYELWRAAGAAGTYARVYRGTARSFTNTALKAGKLYFYKVRAYKTIGTTSYYGPLSAYKAVRPQ